MTQLRYIERNGEKILQHYIGDIIRQGNTVHRPGEWVDVPLVRAEPVQVAEQTVTVTREQVTKAWPYSGDMGFGEFCKALGFKDD